jgi:hypothetical protein
MQAQFWPEGCEAMRLTLWCTQCDAEDGKMGSFRYVPFTDTGSYVFTCERGHRNNIALQQSRFEVLAEVAVQAVADQYFREAVTSFASSLERFYEFYFFVSGIRQGRSYSDIEDIWSRLKSQSERQTGAYVTAYFHDYGVAPELQSNTKTAFRNKVVHQGYIPNESEAIEYGQSVVELVQPVLNQLEKDAPNAVGRVVITHTENARSLGPQTNHFITYVTRMVYRMNSENAAPPNISELVASRREYLKRT